MAFLPKLSTKASFVQVLSRPRPFSKRKAVTIASIYHKENKIEKVFFPP
jgi:hypothetical protein